MRRFLLVLVFLFSSLSLVAQKAESSSHSTGNAQAATPSTPATAGSSSGHCPVALNSENDAPPHGKVPPGRIIHRVNPKYPKELRRAHIEGTVLLCATVGIDGKLHNLFVLSGPTELVPYAREAVEQWLYQPYRVNDEPVAVDSEIRVNFALH